MARKRILICDDEEGIRESMKLILEKDYDLTFAESGDEAIKKVRESGFDLIFLDIKMPRKDGLETLGDLKKTSPNSKVVIATGYKSIETAQEAVRLGATDYIVKPFNRKQIVDLVKKYA